MIKYHAFFIIAVILYLASVDGEGIFWSLQARLKVKEAGEYYGLTPFGFAGRGFETIVSGYDQGDQGMPPTRLAGVYIHNNDDGVASAGTVVWTQQAKLVPLDLKGNIDSWSSAYEFGQYIASFNFTILVGSPRFKYQPPTFKTLDAGAVFVFNGTLRDWTQLQRLLPSDIAPNYNFGSYLALHKDRVLVGAANEAKAQGAVYVFERDSTTQIWSQQQKLKPVCIVPDTLACEQYFNNRFGEKVVLNEKTAVISAHNDDEKGEMSGSAYVFRHSTFTGS